tara:strand:- start:146 stop:373 length:228 start_codon:yes stop_codon:yes gene_type:complete
MIVLLVATTKKRIGSMMMRTLPHWMITDVFLLAMIVVSYEVLSVPSKSSSSSRKRTRHHNNSYSSPFLSRMPSPW